MLEFVLKGEKMSSMWIKWKMKLQAKNADTKWLVWEMKNILGG